MNESLLAVRDLAVCFQTYEGLVNAVQDVTIEIGKGEAVGLLGETGCGKSVTALSVLRLIQPPGQIVRGEILFRGEDLLKKNEKEIERIRGNKISMIFQDPMTSLNPVYTVGDQIAAVTMLHQGLQKKEAMKKTVELLASLRIPDPEKIVGRHPHELSAGMRQRAMIAMSITCNPDLLIADEPTSFLDVSVQAQILRIIEELRERLGSSMLIITHDMGVVAQICDRAYVMYAGKVVEEAPIDELFFNAKHPYTQGLLGAIPKLTEERRRLQTIPGFVSDSINLSSGCIFSPRCHLATAGCSSKVPARTRIAENHFVNCLLYE